MSIHKAGKRKTAIARATLTSGKGRVRVNHVLLDAYEPKLYKLKIMEALMLAGDTAKEVDIDIDVNGGGMMSQAEAARLAIGRCLVEYAPKLKVDFVAYDRNFVVADVRAKEQHKPNCHGTARGRKQKSYR
ncbi:MAG: 30S ribosomal protein S9 [archaeon]